MTTEETPTDPWKFYTLGEDPDAVERGQLLRMLRAYIECRHVRDLEAKRLETMGGHLKDFLNKHPEETLWDGENEIKARLQERKGANIYDLLSLREKDPVLFKRALGLGCVSLDPKAVKLHEEQLVGIERYAGPGKGTVALQVERKKERP